jgi:Flp pilus assembly pilin Flp
MFDRFNAWVGSLYVRSHDLNLKRDEGQTFVEYALVLTLVAVAVVALAAWGGLVTAIKDALDNVASKL